MKFTKIMAWMLVLAMLLPCLPTMGYAAEELGFSVIASAKTAVIGSETEVTISLDGYETASIKGLQVDITGLDSDILEVVDYNTAIADPAELDSTEVYANTASYSSSAHCVRLLYIWESGVLPAPWEDVLTMTVRIRQELTESGSITLPVTVKIVTSDSQQITMDTSCTIRYLTAEEGAVACNSDTGATYETAASALAEAESGQKVMLMADSAEAFLLIPAGVVFDLNGHVMQADNVVSFGAVIDTGETVGGIEISNDTTQAFTKLQPENGSYLPIYDTTDGMYKFFAYELANAPGTQSPDENTVKFGIRIYFANSAAYDILQKTENSMLKLCTKVAWTGSGSFNIVYTVKEGTIKTYAAVAGANANNAIVITFSGLNSLTTGDTVSITPTIRSVTEVGCTIDTNTHTKP